MVRELSEVVAKALIEITELSDLDDAMRRVEEIADLPPNWDSYGAEPVAAHAVATGSALITQVATARLRATGTRIAPDITAPIPDGGLQIEWHGTTSRIEVQVAPDGQLGYLVSESVGEAIRYVEVEDAPFESTIGRILRVLDS